MFSQRRCRCQKDRAPTAHKNQIKGFRLISCSEIQDPSVVMYYQRRCYCRDDDFKDRLINKKEPNSNELPPIKELKNLSLEDEENKKNHRSSSSS